MKRIENKKAKYQYNIIDRYEAGIVLKGQEVKSIREGKVSINESFCKILGDEIFVIDMHISPYQCARERLDPKRLRKLLLHRREINRLIGRVQEKGFTIVPLSLYFNFNGKVKLEIALCQGKRKHDKREIIKRRELEREIKAQKQ